MMSENQRKHTKRKPRRLLVVSLLVLVLLGAAGLLLALRPDARFLAADALTHIGKKANLKTREIPESELSAWVLKEYPVSELTADPRVTVNQSLMLINSAHPLPPDFEAEVVPYKDTEVVMNACVVSAYGELSAAVAERFGSKLYVRSAYRTAEEQQAELAENADVAAGEGESEHQAGLALDVYVPYYAGRGFLKAREGQWVNAEGWRYGFIIRYPYYGQKKTGLPYEPWHLRFVGEPHAQFLTEGRLTLEEYVEGLELGQYYRIGNDIVTRQQGETLALPEFSRLTLSPDNQGNWIATFSEGLPQ